MSLASSWLSGAEPRHRAATAPSVPTEHQFGDSLVRGLASKLP